jgi:hypothetical protein
VKNPTYGQPSSTSQKYNKGKLIVLLQDSISLNRILPLGSGQVKDAMCVISFGNEKPSKEPNSDILRENVDYSEGDYIAVNYEQMRAS